MARLLQLWFIILAIIQRIELLDPFNLALRKNMDRLLAILSGQRLLINMLLGSGVSSFDPQHLWPISDAATVALKKRTHLCKLVGDDNEETLHFVASEPL